MAPRKPAPKKKPVSSGLKAFRQEYGGYTKNVETGEVSRTTAARAEALMAGTLQSRGGYSVNPAYPAETPFANKYGNRIGTYEQSTGAFTLAGGRAPGAGPARGAPKKGAKRKGRSTGKRTGGVGGVSTPFERELAPVAESDLSTTSYLRTQGKAYATGRMGAAASLAGATGAAGGKKKSTGKAGGRKKKGLLKTRGKRQVSGVKPNFHISKSGKVVPNRGGRKARPKAK